MNLAYSFKTLRTPYRVGAIGLGFTAISFQIVLLREFMVSYNGNELSVGIVLSGWLFWTGIGGWIGRYIAQDRIKSLIFFSHAFFVVLIPVMLPGLVWFRGYWGVSGEIVGFIPIIITAFCVEALFCFISGMLFTLYCQTDYVQHKTWLSIGWIYFLDSFGSMIGGLLVSFVFVHLLRPTQLAALLSLLNFLVCMYLLFSCRSRLKIVVLGLLGLFLGLLGGAGISLLEGFTIGRRWPQTNVLANKYTKYGNLVVTRSEEQLALFQNGLFLFSYPGQLEAEENVHLALLQHTAPRDVLMVGSALGGELEEILKHNPETVSYVELDPGMIEISRQFIASLDSILIKDGRIEIVTGDGRFFLATTDRSFDVVILNVPDPCNAQINRFYTREFFDTVKSRLKPAGIFSFAVTSSENYIDQALARYLKVMKETLEAVFPHVVLFPGPRCRYFASKSDVLSAEPDELLARLEQRQLEPQYVNRFYLPFQLTPERKDYLRQQLAAVPVEPRWLNHDYRPISYYFDVMLWSSQFSSSSQKIFRAIERIRLPYYLLVSVAVVLISIVLTRLKLFSSAWFIGLPVAVIGFSEMAVQVILIIAFQVLYGYAYYKLGILVTCLMAGIAAGSAWANVQGLVRPGLAVRRLIHLQGFMGLYPVLLYGLLLLLSLPTLQNLRSLSVIIIFPLLAAIAGFIGGAHFPSAALCCQSGSENLKTTVAGLFWFDLAGSSLGALLLGAFFIPLLGINLTLLLVVSLNIAALGTLILFRQD